MLSVNLQAAGSGSLGYPANPIAPMVGADPVQSPSLLKKRSLSI